MENNQPQNESKVYTSPELIAYGRIEDLTKLLNPGGDDGQFGTNPQGLVPPDYLP
jgi:hypothetical protein